MAGYYSQSSDYLFCYIYTMSKIKWGWENIQVETIKMRAGRHIRISLADRQKHNIQKGEVVLVPKARKEKYLRHDFEVVETTDASDEETIKKEEEKRGFDKVKDEETRKSLMSKLEDLDVDYNKSDKKDVLVQKYLDNK